MIQKRRMEPDQAMMHEARDYTGARSVMQIIQQQSRTNGGSTREEVYERKHILSTKDQENIAAAVEKKSLAKEYKYSAPHHTPVQIVGQSHIKHRIARHKGRPVRSAPNETTLFEFAGAGGETQESTE
ncbi:hypothetical protein NDU88_001225 [Pleurodeles waltl]|uniref:Uncharacterized protein n=1 Tax=Pleurodeles waltl TaxID=8319 RepID=A0AAV7P6D3_PLEWA|nr:hypothetical protein NDU88_001225 [Pleurodeles waltl]